MKTQEYTQEQVKFLEEFADLYSEIQSTGNEFLSLEEDRRKYVGEKGIHRQINLAEERKRKELKKLIEKYDKNLPKRLEYMFIWGIEMYALRSIAGLNKF